MALIICPECGKRVSASSKQCIGCGYPIGVINLTPLVAAIIYDVTIEQLGLSVRAYRALQQSGICTVRDIISKDLSQLMSIKHFGKKSLEELDSRLLELGLSICNNNLENTNNPCKRSATKMDWRCNRAPQNRKYSVVEHSFSSKELELMKRGYIPGTMENKWFCYYENGALHFYRSWTGNLIFTLVLNEQTSKHILVRYYCEEKELATISDLDVIEIIRSMIYKWE